jgi:hypothetical protein
MHTGRSVFSQVLDYLPRHDFQQCVHRYAGDYRLRSFSCLDQFLCMAFAQLTYRESLRDIETCLRAVRTKLYHAGLRGRVSRSTLADANESRDWRIWSDLAHVLIRRARQLYADEPFGVELDQTAYVMDATTIDLCLSLFPWAHFRQHKAGIKLHTLMDLRGNIPCFIRISDAKTAEVRILDMLVPEPGAFYIMDRAYTDFARLYGLSQHLAFFLIRAKRGLAYTRQKYARVNHSVGLRCDQTIRLVGPKTSTLYPELLRRISYYDAETEKRLVFLTNNFVLPALTITQLYRCRWQVELFFKWVKQYLRIKSFYGTSPNAVKTQVWIAITVYVLAAIIRKELRLKRSLGEMLQILSISLFEQMPLDMALTTNCPETSQSDCPNQLPLFDF